MKILYSWLKEFVPIKEPPEKVAELLSVKSFETAVARRMGSDAVLEVGLLPNRIADASSHFGIAREIALLEGRKLEWKMKKPRPEGADIRDSFSCKVSPKTGCRRYMLAAMTGIRVRPSPQWLRKRLAACGIRPLNNVVDATNYVMLELGQPLHAFDADKIAGKRIRVRLAQKGETIETIEKNVYTLSERDVLIADDKGPLALAGVKGGYRAKISPMTNRIVIESANFDPILTRQTSKRHALKTDASWRFENDLDPNAAEIALWRVVALIKELAGGKIMSGVLDYYPKKVLPMPIVASAERISRLIGTDLSVPRIRKLILPFCRSVKTSASGSLLLKVETYRRDIKYVEDIGEEVARLIGYNAIPAIPPAAIVIPGRKNEALAFRERLRDELAALGVSETYNYAFIGERDVAQLDMPHEQLVEVANPTSSEYRYLRTTLLPNLLKNVRDSLRFTPEIRMFEIGKKYSRVPGKAPEEAWQLAGIIAGRGMAMDVIFAEAKGIVESLLERLGLDRDDYRFAELKDDRHLVPGASAEVVYDGKDIVRIGVVRHTILQAYDINATAAYWSIEIEPLRQAVQEVHEFEPLHRYPDVIRDISILVPAFTKVEDVENVIEHAGAKYLEDMDLFDIYDEGLPEDQISMAFHLIFRSPERTLTNEDVSRDMEKIADALRRFGAEIR